LGGTGIRPPDSFSYRSNFRSRYNYRSSFSFSFSFSFRSSFRFRSRSSSCSTTSGNIFYCSGSRQLNHSSLTSNAVRISLAMANTMNVQLNIQLSQGSAATNVRGCGKFYSSFLYCSSWNTTVKE